MIIKRIMPILIGFLMMSVCRLPVFAEEGSKGQVQVVLPEKARGLVVHYAKVGEWTDEELFQNSQMAGGMEKPKEYDGSIEAENGRVSIEHLEDGIYRVDISGSEEYEFTPALVSIPMWSDEEQKMLYEVEVIPKYIRHMLPTETGEPDIPQTEKIQSPKTGDESKAMVCMIFGAISLIIIVIMSCHNRLRCATMSVK